MDAFEDAFCRPRFSTPHHRVTDWAMPRDKFDELVRLCDQLSAKTPHRLLESEVDELQGVSFRGTSLILFIASSYANNGLAFSVKDEAAVSRSGTGSVYMRIPQCTSMREKAWGYSCQYVTDEGPSDSALRIQGNIFRRILRDNAHAEHDMPPILVQPIVLAFNQQIYTDTHKRFEGDVNNPEPNVSTLKHICNVLAIPLDEFQREYPILASTFDSHIPADLSRSNCFPSTK